MKSKRKWVGIIIGIVIIVFVVLLIIFTNKAKTSETLTLQQSEIDTAVAFYKKQDYSDDDARTEAINYLLKREALYQEAIKAGYAATDEEVWAYLDELKEILKNADNKEVAEEAMSVFDSEDDYWAFEFTVYQKNLPIQNYVKTLETQYREKQNNSESAEQTWEDYFEQYKEKLIENRPYEIVE